MFDRFTDRARQAMGCARQESQRFQHDFIAPEHMLLGLLRTVGPGVALLEHLGVDLKRLRARIETRMKPGTTMVAMGHVPFTAEAKRVLELMLEEASRLGHEWLGTEHLVLGLVGERKSPVGAALREMGVTSDAARAHVQRQWGGQPPDLMANLELKARCADLARAREAALAHGAAAERTMRQEDAYYPARSGRLKLRRIDDGTAELIWYHRSNVADTRRSDYEIVPVPDPEALHQVLLGALGRGAVVRKRRELLTWGNVRIHLDTVDDLGTFVEFEAVLGPDDDEETSRTRLAELRAALGIRDEDLVAGSYADL